MNRFLVVLGVCLLALGLAWPWVSKLPLGRLPGDFKHQGEGFTFYLPLTTSLVVSVVVSLILWLLKK